MTLSLIWPKIVLMPNSKKLFTERCRGFTLLELIIVIAIISILYSIVVTVIDPVQKITKAYDSQRLTDINTLNKAVEQYYIDNLNYNALKISTEEKEICDTRYIDGADKTINCGKYINLSVLVPRFVAGIPTDPVNLLIQPKNNPEKLSGNGYTIKINENNRVTIRSINFSTNNSPIQIINNVRIIDTRLQVVILATIVVICFVIAIYFIVKRYRNRSIDIQ